MVVLNDGDPVRIGAARVLGNFFPTLHAVPQFGRAMDMKDDQPGKQRVAVISYALWRSRLGGNPDVLGRIIQIDREGYRVIGVMPKDFAYPHQNDFPGASAALKRTEIWIPAALSPQQESDRNYEPDAVIGRLRPGIALAQAQSEMAAIEKQLRLRYPADAQGFSRILCRLSKRRLVAHGRCCAAVVCSISGSADRVQQRGKSADGARRRPGTRDRCEDRLGGRQNSSHPADVDGIVDARRNRWCTGRAAELCRIADCSETQPRRYSAI